MRKKRILLRSLLAAVLMTLMLAAAAIPADEMAVIGTVVAAATDKSGKVTAVKIMTDEGDYALAANQKARELLEYVDMDVEVTGVVKEADGKKTITVTGFEVIAE
jgi:uncharacterized lipoprotein YajG